MSGGAVRLAADLPIGTTLESLRIIGEMRAAVIRDEDARGSADPGRRAG